MSGKSQTTAMSKQENVLIIDPAQELKFRGEFKAIEKMFAKKMLVKIFSPGKNNIRRDNFMQES